MITPGLPPLILTVLLSPEALERFDEQRRRFFPPERNFLKAHLTLFHALPNIGETIQTVVQVAQQYQPFSLAILQPVSIGKGVAYKVESAPLQQLHEQLRQLWLPLLSPQDKQKLWPHITVQNKVTPAVAQQTLLSLQNTFVPFTTTALGLQVWEYLNGPWRLKETFAFG